MKTENEWLKPKEAAELLNVSESWFRGRWHEFDAVALTGGAYRIPRKAIDRYLEARKIEA